MDSEALSAIAQLLSGSTGPKIRATACSALAACTAEEAGTATRELIGTTSDGETIIRRLLTISSDSRVARLSLTALVNISEDEDAAATMIRASAVERCANSLLDPDEKPYVHLHSGLLSNLTRLPAGVDALVGKGKGTTAANAAVHTLLKLVSRIDQIPQALWMSNACSTEEGRAALLLRGQEGNDDNNTDVNRQPLTWLLRLLASPDYATRLAAASAVRNCAMTEDCHDTLVNRTNALGVCMASLVGPKTRLTLSHVQEAPKEVQAVLMDPTKIKPEAMVEIRLIIVESLLLLCKTLTGRSALRRKDACAVLSDWSEQETDDQILAAVMSIIERITTEIEEEIEEEGKEQVTVDGPV